MLSSNYGNQSLASYIYKVEKKYNKVFTNYDELAVKLKEEFDIIITGKEIYDYEDNYYASLATEDAKLIVKNILA